MWSRLARTVRPVALGPHAPSFSCARGPQWRSFATAEVSHPPVRTVVMMVTGPNRVGLVQDLCAKVVTPSEGHILKSRMTCVGADFAAMLHVKIPGTQMDNLKEALEKEFPDCLLVVKPTGSPSEPVRIEDGDTVSISAPDDLRLVSEVCDVIAAKGWSIDDLHADVWAPNQQAHNVYCAQVRARHADGNFVLHGEWKAALEPLQAKIGLKMK